jgi:hypothetical protein
MDEWLRPIKQDRKLPRNAYIVADEIARGGFNRKHFNANGELLAWPSIETLVSATGLSRRTITPTRLRTAIRWKLHHPRGPRSSPGYSVPVRHHLTGPIRPARRHIAISPHGGLYVMPSLCGST